MSIASPDDQAQSLAARATHFTVADLFRRSVRVFGDRVAVVSSEVEFAYRELDERTNRLAHVPDDAGLTVIAWPCSPPRDRSTSRSISPPPG